MTGASMLTPFHRSLLALTSICWVGAAWGVGLLKPPLWAGGYQPYAYTAAGVAALALAGKPRNLLLAKAGGVLGICTLAWRMASTIGEGLLKDNWKDAVLRCSVYGLLMLFFTGWWGGVITPTVAAGAHIREKLDDEK